MTDHQKFRDQVLGPIRREAGWPEEMDEPVTSDEINRYIELLEAHAIGNAMAMETIREVRGAR